MATAFRCTAMWRRYRAIGRFQYNGGQVRAATVDFCQVRQPQWRSHLRHAAADALYFAKIRKDSCLTSPTSRVALQVKLIYSEKATKFCEIFP